MASAIRGSQAIARGALTRGQLRWRYESIFPDIYVPRGTPASLYTRTVGAWLWSRERGVVTGRAAAAFHGAQWVGENSPIELLLKSYATTPGIIARGDRFGKDEVVMRDGMAVATVERTAYDLGRHLPPATGLIHLDALTRATGLNPAHVSSLISKHKGARGVRRLRKALDLMDGGSQSPRETLLRLLLIDAGFPRPQTQIPVWDGHGEPFAYLDLGWEEAMIAVEYDGDQHRTDRSRYVWDQRRLRRILDLGWQHVRVIAEDRRSDIVERVRRAWAAREPSSVVV